ncbi:MAG TPA: hypothetical protein VF877_06185 [Gaiellaceae bacterium]
MAALIDHGPPFDAEKAGLERYHVFLTDREAIFLVEADVVDGEAAATVWGATASWQDLGADPPRLAEEAFSWVRPHLNEYISSNPSPGPGDSEGGDLFAPDDTRSAR